MNTLTDQQRLLLGTFLVIVTTVCAFEFVYLIFTATKWAVIPLGVGVGSFFGLSALDPDNQKKKDFSQ